MKLLSSLEQMLRLCSTATPLLCQIVWTNGWQHLGDVERRHNDYEYVQWDKAKKTAKKVILVKELIFFQKLRGSLQKYWGMLPEL